MMGLMVIWGKEMFKINLNHRLIDKMKSLIQRLYLINTWYNKNRYIER